MTKAITLVEIDIDRCSLTYGSSPCTASIPSTGDNKCFNSRKTCQDVSNINLTTKTVTFSKPNSYLPSEFNSIPCIENISFSPSTVSLGENLGQRASITIQLKDHRHSDVGFDDYLSDRNYDPYNQGTFFGKFRARFPFLRGNALRLKRGFLGDDLADFETWNFVIESFDGPNPQGMYTIVAKDILKLADGDRAQAPKLSGGFLSAALTSSATSFTVNPSGIGNSDYPSSGEVAIGGKEIVSFTRSGDVFTITRAQRDTEAVAHDADARVQLCLIYTADDPGDIIRDLLVNYANVPSSYIDLPAWNTETGAFLGSVYSSVIAEPTSIKKLVTELIEQAALFLYWEPLSQKIILKVLKEIATDADTFDLNHILQGSFSSNEQPKKRISQVWTYFAKTNPLTQLDRPESYKSTIVTIDTDAEVEYGSPIIKKIFSRWVPLGGRSIASRLNDIQLARYRDPPRKFSFALFHNQENVSLGGGYQLGGYQIQNDLGEEVTAPIQITRLGKDDHKYSIEAQEVLFGDLDPIDPDDHTIIFDSNTNDVNLKTVHDSLFPAATADTVVSVYIESGVIVGSSSSSTIAFDVGTGWPAGTTINIYPRGRIQGAGGAGGGSGTSTNGEAGGTAILTTVPISIDFEGNVGELWSGGGGGGAVKNGGFINGGGGGAGTVPGLGGAGSVSNPPGQPGNSGTATSGGSGAFQGGRGGDPGLNGSSASGNVTNGAGGTAGNAIDGVSNVTFLNDGSADIRGPQTG